MAGFTPVNAVRRPPPGAASTQDSKGKESQHISGGKSVDKTVNARSAGNGSSTTTTYPTHHVNPYIYPQQRSRAYPPLDMASVRKRSDGLQTVVKTDRPFGLTEAPTFYPTLEEFGDPAAYLEKIAPRGKKFGMAKIVPPKGWDPPFCLDTEMFWFKTKRQSMNPTLAERAEKAFVDSLYYFHRHTNKTPINRLPSIDKRPLDLFHLHQCVQLRGGFTEVCRRKLWAQIGRELGYTGKIMTSLSTSLKHSYQKVIYPFDQYLERNSVGLLADGIRIPMFEAPDETSEENNSNEEQEQVSLPQKREHPDDDSDERSGATKKHKLENGTKVARRVRGDERRASQVKNSEATLHRVVPYSDTPSIPDDPTIPPFDNWHGGINTIGDPSDNLTAPTYNLRQFQQKAALFKDKYFQPILGDKPKLEEEDVEREFWRILSDPTENIQVEYGTDIHTSVQSSGFPQIERDVTNRYSQDPWNLNVLPFVHKALSRYVDADVSYLVQPFLHIGMVFSSKSWHFEDFYSYAFNYHHFGEAKTYYSVPEDQTEKLRELLTEIIGKDNIDQDPSLLLQPNHMLSPELLIQRGIICHALDQRAGQFVVTFPKAYTSHVNYGFNMTESVNFFPAFDWLDYGLQCASLYQQFNYPPPFSIQRLLLTTSATSHNINIAKLVLPVLKDIINDELMSRMQIRQRYPNLTEEKEDTVLGQYPGHEKFQCEGTKALSCLSRVVKQKSDDEGEDKVMSLEQFLEMGVENGEENGYTFVCSFSDDELLTACEKLQDRALAPENWYDRLSKFIKSEPRPSLEDLQKFADEGDSIFYDLKPLVPLKGILRRSQEWIEQINGLLSGSGYWPLNRFKRIISSVSEMDIMIPESQRVIEHANKVKNYTKRVFQLLKQTTIDSSQVKQLLEESKTIHVDLQEIDLLSRLRARFDWLERAKAVLSNSKSVFMDELDKIIMEGRQSGLERDDSVIQQLSYRRLLAEQLEAKIKSMVTTDRVAPATLDKFLEDMKGLPVSRKLYENIRDNRSECQRLEGELINLSETSKRENVMLRPGFNHAKQVLEASRVCVTKPDVVWLDKGIQLVEDWFRRGKKLFGKGHAQVHVLRNQVLIAERRNESAFSLDDRRGGPRKCICREEGETNFDVRCQRCLETYHGKCLKLNRHNTDILHFTCPICDWRLNIPRDGLRPKLKELDEWVKQAKTLPFCPEEFPVLEHMVKQGKEFKKYIRSHIDLNAPSTLPVGDLKFYLCKLTGGELLFLEEINYLRSEIHRLDHVASDPPPPILDISLPATKRATPQPQLPQPRSQQFQPQTEQHHQQNHHNPYPQYQQTQQHNVSQQQQQQQPSQLSSRNTLSSSPGLLPPPFVSTPTLPQSPRPYSATPPPLPQLSSYKLPQPSQLPFQKRSNTDSPHPPADDPK